MDAIKIYQECELGNLEPIKKFIEANQNDLNSKISVSMMPIFAVKGNSLNIIEYLYDTLPNSKELYDSHNIKLLIQATCFQKKTKIFKYIINKFNTNEILDSALDNCVMHNNPETLKYLFDRFPDNKKFDEKLQYLIRLASTKGNLDIIEYIFNDEQIRKKAEQYLKDETFLSVAYNNKHMNVVNYFLFDLKIEETPKLKNYIKSIPELKKMFETRDNYFSLQDDLDKNEPNTSKKLKL